jgi:hypothetical protein
MNSLGSNEIKYAQGSAARYQLQSFRYSSMRFLISMALVPRPVAGKINPICHEPDLFRHVLRAENIHPHKPRCTIDKVRTENKSLLDCASHVVGDNKPAQNANRLLFQWNNSSARRQTSRLSLRHTTRQRGLFSPGTTRRTTESVRLSRASPSGIYSSPRACPDSRQC